MEIRFSVFGSTPSRVLLLYFVYFIYLFIRGALYKLFTLFTSKRLIGSCSLYFQLEKLGITSEIKKKKHFLQLDKSQEPNMQDRTARSRGGDDDFVNAINTRQLDRMSVVGGGQVKPVLLGYARAFWTPRLAASLTSAAVLSSSFRAYLQSLPMDAISVDAPMCPVPRHREAGRYHLPDYDSQNSLRS